MSLVVRAPGLQSLLVDFGRPRSRSLGVPLGGAADRAAFILGNALVGNPPDAVAVEVAFAGPTLEADHPTACVIFGAVFQSAVNGTPVRAGVTLTLEPGDVLRVGGTSAGARAYVCVAGGFDAPEVLGSRAALEPLRTGDTLVCPPSRTEPRSLPFIWGRPSPEEPTPGPSLKGGEEGSGKSCSPLPSGRGAGGVGPSLRVLDGPQRDWFTDGTFFTRLYEVSAASNRMGVRLKGAPLARRAGELASEAVAPGAVQVTNDGLPVVLGVDGQTIGGYPKVAHVIRADLDALAQLRPGDRVRFVRVTPDEAEAAAATRDAFLREWLTRLRIAERQPVLG
ncbi:5-oxoprolinase subunit C family protein [Frigoriglobus tundricola]|uniref:Urea carboxylase n=1 Tax=Frigoriglobus tundricola TaxID=2774151 RepID=A0A6M5YP85_9BACT|nr:biotin-dependent carboxyltransferase family protein [Frigoriglobus tundricola]QJW95304.1 Urea carboxylase [Frigoriglobus tundricola]